MEMVEPDLQNAEKERNTRNLEKNNIEKLQTWVKPGRNRDGSPRTYLSFGSLSVSMFGRERRRMDADHSVD